MGAHGCLLVLSSTVVAFVVATMDFDAACQDANRIQLYRLLRILLHEFEGPTIGNIPATSIVFSVDFLW